MNSVYGLLSTEPIYSPPNAVGCVYLPYFPGYMYAAIPDVSEKSVNTSELK